MGKQKKNRQGADKTFNRKKVKVGRKLPKSTNVTNTKFKTKTIQIIQQLKKDEDGQATTKRKLNIKALLSQCQHYNMTVRLAAAKGLKELLTVSEEAVVAYLGLVVDRAGSLMTDKDCIVREAVLKLFESLFEKVPANCMSPFFPVLCAHLCCAMTHINTEIQHDSLSMFDLLIKTYPELIVSSSNQLLSNFLEQISKQKLKGTRLDLSSVNKSPKLSLNITPNRQLSSQKWQFKVLVRLFKLLSIVLSEEDLHGTVNQENMLHFADEKPLGFFPSFIKKSWAKPGFVIKSSRISSSSSEVLYDIQRIQQLVSNLFPLMLQCWVESHDSEKNDGSLLYPETISIRSTVLNIILLLIEYGAKHSDALNVSWKKWLSNNFESSFENYFLASFPFELLQGKKVKKQKKEPVNVSPETLNLAICNVMTKFIRCPKEFLLQQSWVQTILKYVRYMIKSPDLPLDGRRQLLQVLNRLIYIVKPSDQTALLDDCYARYDKVHHLSQEKQLFIKFLSQVTSDTREQADLCKPLIQFLESLPDLLLLVGQSNKAIPTQIVDVIKNAVTSNCKAVVAKWQSFIERIYDPEHGIFLSGSTSLQKSLSEMLYWVPEINPKQLRLFAKLLQNDGLTLELGKYLIQILHQRCLKSLRKERNIDVISDHVGFMILIMTGSDILNMSELLENLQRYQKQLELDLFISQILRSNFQPFDTLIDDVMWSSLNIKVSRSTNKDQGIVLCFLAVLATFKTTENISETLTNSLIHFVCCLMPSQISENGEVRYLWTLIEEALCGLYLKQFVDIVVKNILSTKDESADVDLAKMLSRISNLQNVRTYILNNVISVKRAFCEDFRSVVSHISEKHPCFRNENWLSELEYLAEQLS